MSCTKRLSPGANLLRKSRLVAMPAPVPPPPSYFLNNPSVSPYPTIQAITTPGSSHARGNWGLKRDLPTKTKYPFLRYKKLDTLEHFTEYESAGDDVITLKKWQEMDIPIFKGLAIDQKAVRNTYAHRESVFSYNGRSSTESYKWRYNGPYLPDMSAQEFKRYIETQIKPRRQEFVDFVARNLLAFASESDSHTYDGQGRESRSPIQLARDSESAKEKKAEGVEGVETEGVEGVETEGVEEKKFKELDANQVDILALRADSFLLERLVLAFLDIPFHSRPHRTHPSGGLHYIRSSAHVRNDPIEGPRQEAKSVLGRYMNYSGPSGSMIGVGGFIAKAGDAMRLDGALKLHNNRQYTRKYLPGMAMLDAHGRVLLDVDTVNEDGSRGNFGTGGGERALEMLKSVPVPREWDALYNAGGEAEATPGPKVRGVVGKNPERDSYTEAIMDMLAGSIRR